MTEEVSKRVVVNKEARKIVIQRKPPPVASSTSADVFDKNKEDNEKKLTINNEINSLDITQPVLERQDDVDLTEQPLEKKPKEQIMEEEPPPKATVEKKLSALERLKALNFSAPKSAVNPFSLTAPTKSSMNVSITETTTVSRPARPPSVESFSKNQNNESQRSLTTAVSRPISQKNANVKHRKQPSTSAFLPPPPKDDNRPKSLLDLDIKTVPKLLHQLQSGKNFSSFSTSTANDQINFPPTGIVNSLISREFNSELHNNVRFLNDFPPTVASSSSAIARMPSPPPPPPQAIPQPLFSLPNINAVSLIRFNNGLPVPPPPLAVVEDRPPVPVTFCPPPFVQPLIELKDSWLNNAVSTGFAYKDSLEREKLETLEITAADLNSLSLVGLKRTCEYLLEIESELACHSNRLACQIKSVQRALDCGPQLPPNFHERLKLKRQRAQANSSRKVGKTRNAQKSNVATLNDETFSKALCKAINEQAEARKKAMNFGPQVPSQRNETESNASGEYDYMAVSKVFFAGMASGVMEKLKVSNLVQGGNSL